MEDIEHFARFTGDTFYAHMDEEAAAANPFFPGPRRARLSDPVVRRRPVRRPRAGTGAGQYGVGFAALRQAAVARRRDGGGADRPKAKTRRNDDYGEVRWAAVVTDSADDVVATYDLLTMVAI